MPRPTPYTPEVVELLSSLHDLCCHDDLGYVVNYCEADDTWYISLTSAAPSSCITMKNYGYLENALKTAIRFILGPDKETPPT